MNNPIYKYIENRNNISKEKNLKANMDVHFLYANNISNITIDINPELANNLHVGDELEFNRNQYSNSTMLADYHLLADFFNFFFDIYPQENYLYIKVKRKIYVNGGDFIRLIASVESPIKE